MIWAYGWLVWTAPVVVIMGIIGIYRYLRIQHSMQQLAAPEHQSHMFRHFSLVRIGIRIMLCVCALVLVWLALLRPQGAILERPVSAVRGRDVIIALDIS